LPQTLLGELTALPQTPSWDKGVLPLRKGRMLERGRGRGRGKEIEGRERGKRRGG